MRRLFVVAAVAAQAVGVGVGDAHAEPPAPRRLTARAPEVRIHRRPDVRSGLAGLLRAGMDVPLKRLPKGPLGPCDGGWVALAGAPGFVCTTRGVGVDQPSTARDRALAKALPSRQEHPLHYGVATGARRLWTLPAASREALTGPAPWTAWFAQDHQKRSGFAFHGQKLAWAGELRAGAARYVVLSDLSLVDASRVREVAPRGALGVALGGERRLPLAFTRREAPRRTLRGEARGEVVPRHRWIAVTATERRAWGRRLRATADGAFVDARDLSVATLEAPPQGLAPGERWVSVHVHAGTLTLYEGRRPVFVAPIAAGAHGTAPKQPYRTPTGRFRVSSKHRTADMSGGRGVNAWRIRDVPWVAYYDGSFAIHGAWWHDGFGMGRSHGCVNLRPADALRVFGWLEPALPAGWHAVVAHRKRAPGTLVVVRP